MSFFEEKQVFFMDFSLKEGTVIPYFFFFFLQWRKQAQGVLIFQNTFFVCRREYARIYSKPSKHGW